MNDSSQPSLPSDVKNYLFSPEIVERNKQITDKYKFGDKERKLYFGIILRLFLKKMTLFSLPAVLMKELKIGDDKIIKSLMQDIKEIVLSPVKEYFGMNGGRQRGYEFNILIEKAVEKFGLKLDAAGRKRFSEAAESFLYDARTKAQFKNTLIKETSAGGLGMETDLAAGVADFLASHLRLRPVIAKSETKKQSGAMAQGDEEAETVKMKKKIEDIRAGAPKLMSVSEGVKKALEEINLILPSSELNERLKIIVDARIRNVRTSLQTFEKLCLDVRSGGLGLPRDEADRISWILNKYIEGKSKDIYEGKVAEIKQFEEKEKTRREERERQEEDARQKMLNEKFKKLTGKEDPLTSLKKATPSAAPSEARAKTMGAAPSKDEKAIGKQIPLPPEEAPYFSVKKPTVIPDALAERGRYSGIQKSETSAARPVVEDIVFTPKLVGPVEEIGAMTINDFRKLSGDAEEAISKIKNKLSLLRDESFKQYQAGLEAWKKSPLYAEYLKAVGQSLSGAVSLDDILRSGKSLTREEFNAIVGSEGLLVD